jgi:hypothetical protein
MANRDLTSNIGVVTAIAPGVVTTGSHAGVVIDTRGFDSVAFAVAAGTVTDGTHTPALLSSSDGTLFAPVVAPNLQGTLAAVASNTVQRVGYVGNDRYLRLDVVSAGATAGAALAASAILGNPAIKPVA